MEDKNPHYVTPEEADQKLCPMAKPNTTYIDQRCNGPACMAWRWQEIAQDLAQYKDGVATPVGRHVIGYSDTYGYCGMVRHG
jgi:hypothetical protein